MKACGDCEEFIQCPNNNCYYGFCTYFNNYVAETDEICNEMRKIICESHGDDVYDMMMDSKEE